MLNYENYKRFFLLRVGYYILCITNILVEIFRLLYVCGNNTQKKKLSDGCVYLYKKKMTIKDSKDNIL